MMDHELAALARTLSRDHELQVCVGGDHSFCSNDGRRIQIARMPSTPRGRRLMCGLVFHELGHKAFTQGERPPGLLGALTNVLEDIRVEAATIRQRPGTRFDLDAVVGYYADTRPSVHDACSALLGVVMARGRAGVLRQQSLAQNGALAAEMLTQTIGQGATQAIETLIDDQLPGLESTAQSQDLAQRILQCFCDAVGPARAEPNSNCAAGKEPECAGGECDANAEKQKTIPDKENRKGCLTAGGDKGASSATDLSSRQDAGAGLTQEALQAMVQADYPEADLGRFILTQLNELGRNIGHDRRTVAEYPAVRHYGGEWAGRQLDQQRALRVSCGLRRRLPALLQTLRRTAAGQRSTGKKLCQTRLYRYGMSDPRLFLQKRPQPGVDTAIQILIDASGSMGSVHQGQLCYRVANEAAYALHHALYALSGVAVSSAAFTNTDEQTPAIHLLTDFGHRPVCDQFDLTPQGGTPTDQALWYARTSLLARKEARKLIVLLTDGRPNNIPATQAATRCCEQDGIEIVALGILSDAVARYWNCYRVLHQLDLLPQVLFGMLEQGLLVSAGRCL
ncbi:MAG: VWA domain-containing protein [Desulfuromonadaceae bacterium]|nr:VWA domain-containing protein [Desulfuromonadaceae bacterium]